MFDLAYAVYNAFSDVDYTCKIFEKVPLQWAQDPR